MTRWSFRPLVLFSILWYRGGGRAGAGVQGARPLAHLPGERGVCLVGVGGRTRQEGKGHSALRGAICEGEVNGREEDRCPTQRLNKLILVQIDMF